MRPTECTGLKPGLAAGARNKIASAPSATVATRILSPGFAEGSAAVSINPACAAPVCPIVKANESENFVGSILSARDLVRGAGVGRIEDYLRQIARRDFRLLQHVLDDGAE